MPIPTYAGVPDLVSGFDLSRFLIQFIKPRAAINLVINPSVEIDTVGYAAFGSSAIARVSTQQRRGAWSLQVTPTAAVNDGVSYAGATIVAGITYYASVDFLGAAGVRFNMQLGNSSNFNLHFTATGKWQRIVTTLPVTVGGTAPLYIYKRSNASVAPFYIDGVQIEIDRQTTYLDGSMSGFIRDQIAYLWNGAEHASTSSRVAFTRSGGELINPRDYGFSVLGLMGLGLNSFTNLTHPSAFLGGSNYERTIQTEYGFDIVGSLTARTLSELTRNRSDLISVLKPGAGILQQPLLVRFQYLDESDIPMGEPVDIECLFAGGLQGQIDNYNQERLALSFTITNTYVAKLDGSVGAEMDFSTTFAANDVIGRIDGQWSALGAGMNGAVFDVAIDEQRGRVYFGGNFSSPFSFICYWDIALQAFVGMDGGTNTFVNSIAIAANGDVWVAGAFTTVGTGAAATKGLARWNIATSTWTAFNESTASFTSISSVVISPSGVVYIAGNFTDWEGDVASDYIAKTSDNGVNWDALGTSPFTATNKPNFGGALTFDAAGNLWIGAGTTGTEAVSLRKWDGATWTVIASTNVQSAASINALLFGADGALYVGGVFLTLGGVSAISIARYNGSSIVALGAGVGTGASGTGIYELRFTLFGLTAVGQFTSAGGSSLNDRIAAWTGSSWVSVDISLSGTPPIYGIQVIDDDIYIGFNGSETASIPGTSSVTNSGSANSYPIVKLTGPGAVESLANNTTGDILRFNLTLAAGEIAILDLTSGQIKFSSNFRPNLLGTILSGSTLATFRLVPGVNVLSLLISGSTGATLATLDFVPRYASLDDVLYRS